MQYLIAVLSDRIQAEAAYTALEQDHVPMAQVSLLGRGYKSADEFGLINPNQSAQTQAKQLMTGLVPLGFILGYTLDLITGTTWIAGASPWVSHLFGGCLGAVFGGVGGFLVGGGGGPRGGRRGCFDLSQSTRRRQICADRQRHRSLDSPINDTDQTPPTGNDAGLCGAPGVMVRIYGNRPLKTLRGLDTRPTTAQVREAVFNIWQGQIARCRWLDLCCGCGAMGAEALCRGAQLVVGIEQAGRACTVIRHNWQQVVQPHQTIQILKGDVRRQLSKLAGQQFDYIYFDPPYASDLYGPVLRAIDRIHLLAVGGQLAVEHARGTPLISVCGALGVDQVRTYGKTAVTFYQQSTR